MKKFMIIATVSDKSLPFSDTFVFDGNRLILDTHGTFSDAKKYDFVDVSKEYAELDYDTLSEMNVSRFTEKIVLKIMDADLTNPEAFTTKTIYMNQKDFVPICEYQGKNEYVDLFIKVGSNGDPKFIHNDVHKSILPQVESIVKSAVRELNKQSYNNSSFELFVKNIK